MNEHDAWNVAYSQLELQLDRATFDTWLQGATLLRVEEGVFVVGVRNTYARDMLQHRLYRNIRRVLSDVLGRAAELRFEVFKPVLPRPKDDTMDMPLFRLLAEQKQQSTPETPLHEHVSRPQHPDVPESELKPGLVFDRFMVNNSNRLAFEAAKTVMENPGRHYNPLLIYGGVGLGKTHLLQSIAHGCQTMGLRAIYIPSEAFTNDLIASIKQRTTAMFREKYRTADVLLIDDIQFISGKDSTQEEFFHTFNALYTHNKQIVLASDRHPRELKTLEDRLRSRFEGGLVVDIPPLEFETRIAIIEMWSRERGVRLPYSVIEMIAERAHNNVRQLEGMFNQLVMQSQFRGQPLTQDTAERSLSEYTAPREHRGGSSSISLEDVIHVTASYFSLKASALTGKGRTQRVNQARQVAMYLSRDLTEASLPQIGEAFGGRSHTTVLHGCNKIMELMNLDTAFCAQVDEIRHLLGEARS